jgi:hypothetical protein
MKEILEAINKTKNSPFFWQYTDLNRLKEVFIPSGWERQHVIMKELCDNALDAIERTTVPGKVAITLTSEGVFRVRNPGTIPVDELRNFMDLNLSYTSKSGKRSLLRGALGYGFRIAILLQDLESRPFIIRTDGKQFEVRLIDRLSWDPKGVLELRETGDVPFKGEVEVEACLPNVKGVLDLINSFIIVNPHVQFTVNIDGKDRRFKRTARTYKKDVRLDLDRYDEQELRELIRSYKYDAESSACLFLDRSQLYEIKLWLPRTLKDDRWTENKHFSTFMKKLRSLYNVNPVRPAPFGESALKSRVMQVLELSKGEMSYGSINPYEHLKSNQGRGRGDHLNGTVEFVRFKGERIHVVSVNSTVLPGERLMLETPWDSRLRSVEDLVRGKDGQEEGIAFVYQTTDQILKGLNKMEWVYIDNKTIPKLIVPPGERGEMKRKNSRMEWINPQWLEAKKAEGYKDQEMQKLFSKQYESLSLLTDEIVPLVKKLFEEIGRISLRQMYYQVVVRGLIFNTSRSSKNFDRLLIKLREWGILEYDLFEDRSRTIHRPNLLSFDVSPAEYFCDLISGINQPQLDIWEDQDSYVELWVEKEALLPLLEKIGERWRISTFPLKGFASKQKLYESYKHLESKKREGKRCVILYMGDLDPSGMGIFKALKEKPLKQWRRDLREFLGSKKSHVLEGNEEGNHSGKEEETNEKDEEAEGVLCERLMDVTEIERIALTEDQVDHYLKPHGLFDPDIQEIKMSDTRAKGFLEEFGKRLGHRCYELDALSPKVFLKIAHNAIAGYFDRSKAGDENKWKRIFEKYRDNLLKIAIEMMKKGKFQSDEN